jgi:hypothetical protein
MANINIVYLAGPTRGGWPTYTAHLAYGIEAAGHHVQLWRVGKHTEERNRPFGRGLRYRNASKEFLTELARQEPTHIAASDAKNATVVKGMLAAGATITIHDPTELKGDMPAALAESRAPVTVIRASMVSYIHNNIGALPVRFVRHPYFRMVGPRYGGERSHAVAFSRLDWDKGTHHIVHANLVLDREHTVQMYGAENRMYTHHKLAEIDPDWRRNYGGPWPTDDLWGGVQIAERARVAVDMSAIKGDGGGTQYTFLEAIDAGCVLMLNQAWLTMDTHANEMLGAAMFVDPERLADALTNPLPVLQADKLLERHEARARALETVGLA